jgi:hypothetical protein
MFILGYWMTPGCSQRKQWCSSQAVQAETTAAVLSVSLEEVGTQIGPQSICMLFIHFVHVQICRFTRNNFADEKNHTIVTFPIKNLEMKDYLSVSGAGANGDSMNVDDDNEFPASIEGIRGEFVCDDRMCDTALSGSVQDLLFIS